MTGFGGARAQTDNVAYDVEIRAVNHRYFKAVVRLPDVWASAEADIEKRLRSQLHRGSITATVRMKITDAQAACQVNAAALDRYVQQLRMVEIEANPTLRIDLGSLLQLPGVCEPPSLDDLCEHTRQTLFELVDRAIDELLGMRTREGEALAVDLRANCDALEQALGTIKDRAPMVLTEYHERLAQRVAELTNAGQVDIDADVLAREVAIYAERSDVAEEITRLSGHLDQFRQAVAGGGAVGRRLDFIAQEMLREANTIGSKSGDAATARAVVDIKTAVDRLKEQVQNAE